MSRITRIVLLASIALCVAAPAASAVPAKKLDANLGAMWKKVLETPSPQNPFTPGVGPVCVDLGGVVAPFAAYGEDITCTVKPGTKIFVAGWSAECSTLEAGTVFFGSNEAELRKCARDVNAGITTHTAMLDGKVVALTKVSSPLQRLRLPADNIFGADPGSCCTEPGDLPYLSVADGWVALLHPLTPGTHTIKIDVAGQFPGVELPFQNITTIIVKPGL